MIVESASKTFGVDCLADVAGESFVDVLLVVGDQGCLVDVGGRKWLDQPKELTFTSDMNGDVFSEM